MSTNNSKRLLEAKIKYKQGLIETEKTVSQESIKPVQGEGVSPKKASLIRKMFKEHVETIKQTWEKTFPKEFGARKPIASIVNVDTRKVVAKEI